MKYENIKPAMFLSRPNRFIAKILINGHEETCHVKNTGRCRELLLPESKVFVQHIESQSRKTKYDLISVTKNNAIVNIDSQIPNKVFYEWIERTNYFGVTTLVKPESFYEKSRFDFYIETATGRKIFVEIKGVTLEEDGIVAFPDAPTQRGLKHINELQSCVQNGFEAYLFFVVQMENATLFVPNIKTHKAFADALKEAEDAGVVIKAVNCIVTEDSIDIKDFIPIDLNGGGIFGQC